MITAQEKEIMCRLVQGEEIKMVAQHMGMHPKNVDYHISKLKRRFNAKTLVALGVLMSERGLLNE